MKYLIFIALLAVAAFVWFKWRQPRFIAGDQAPDFEVQLKDGTKAKLSDLRGKFVLLQFWGSWCGPCRQENKHLTKVYNAYKDSGLEIFSVGIESSEKAWQSAIINDMLVWKYHSMEAQDFKGGAATLYNIHSIPATFLINPEGVVMGVNLRGELLDKILKEKLGAPKG